MFSLWLSNQEKGERVKHVLLLSFAFIFFSIFLFFLNLPILQKADNQNLTFSSVFNIFKSYETLTKSIRYFCIAILVLVTSYLIYGSTGELLSLFVPPNLQSRAKKYHWSLTLLTFAPLLCTLVISWLSNSTEEKDKDTIRLSSASHYLFFQFYFLLGNRVCWRFFCKFLVPEIESNLEGKLGAMRGKSLQQIGSKLIKQHYLGWTAFFLLAIFLPFWVLILVLAIAFFNNSFSFIFGRKLGSTRISEYSPTKTLEGTVLSFLLSSLLFSILVILIFRQKWLGWGDFTGKKPWFYFFAVILVVSTSFFSLWGDQRFSLCKRVLGYKNFGRLFGKRVGGFWDRCDSLAPALFSSSLIFWVALAIVKRDIGILSR